MDFSLSNSLTGSAVLKPSDGLALDLQFSADKTLTARKGPTPVLTRASSATFVGSNGLIQSAGTNVARFDHDPVTLACKGLLIEESRTNSIADSNAFNNWSMFNSTVAASSVANPEGSLSAWKVVEDSLLTTHTVTRSFTPVSGTTYTASVWLKSAENGFALVGLAGGGFATTFISANLSTGAVSTALGTPLGATSVTHSNGWWRVSFSLAATAALVSTIDIRLSRDGLWANRSYLGNGVNGIYCYGAQLEAGAFPTSYIPTTTASAIRSADVCSISSISSFYAGLGTLFAGSVSNGASGSTGICGFNTSNTIQISINRLPAVVRGQTNGTSPSALLISATILPTTFAKTAFAFNTNDAAFATNGVLSATTTSLTLPSVSAFQIGGNGGQILQSGTITEIKYFRKRLSNAKLQALTV